MQAQILAPAAVLVAWSLVILVWMTSTRLGTMSKMGIKAGTAKPGGRGKDLDGVLPDPVNWKAHNYTHLMETPTLFYAVVVIIALLGASASDVLVAWIYVALRILHSLWQSLVNTIPWRLRLFALSVVALAWLTVSALRLTLGF
jgi:hypothetical protein